jgi:hypothetical protein
MLVEIDLRDCDPAVPTGSGLSIGFTATAHHVDTIGGRRIRVIDSMSLRHIAIVTPGSGREPAYPLATLRSAKPGSTGKLSLDYRIDTGLAMKRQSPALVARLRK